jgi:hypothetical protein
VGERVVVVGQCLFFRLAPPPPPTLAQPLEATILVEVAVLDTECDPSPSASSAGAEAAG